MSHQPDHSGVRRVVLPSGKTIEVKLSEQPARPVSSSATGLHVCPTCASELVHPIAWAEHGPEHWEVTLRCPECYGRRTAVHHQTLVEALDIELDHGADALLADLRRLAKANLEDEITRFVAALQADLLLPEDF
jgi:Zn finger protein HypA/HybF involved in hydrogenase expression